MPKLHKCGAMDSKYFSNTKQFEMDIEKNKDDSELFKLRLQKLMLQEPNKIEQRYFEAISVMVEIKKEFGL